MKDKILTTTQAAKILGIESLATIENWLHGGHFPGASQIKEGQWSFKFSEVLAVKEFITELNRKNGLGDLTPPAKENEE